MASKTENHPFLKAWSDGSAEDCTYAPRSHPRDRENRTPTAEPAPSTAHRRRDPIDGEASVQGAGTCSVSCRVDDQENR